MRVVVIGASGNVGTSVLRELADEPAVESVLGLCRRVPELRFPKVEWRAADVTSTPLAPLFRGRGCRDPSGVADSAGSRPAQPHAMA